MCERRHREPHDTIILLPGFTASSYIAAGSRYRAAVLTSVPTMIAMILRERFDRGSHRTRRWREMDSNPRSPVRETALFETAPKKNSPELKSASTQCAWRKRLSASISPQANPNMGRARHRSTTVDNWLA